MNDYKKLVEDLRDIEKTMFALGSGTLFINMDNVSIKLAYDKKWGQTASAAADALEELIRTRHNDPTVLQERRYRNERVRSSDEDANGEKSVSNRGLGFFPLVLPDNE